MDKGGFLVEYHFSSLGVFQPKRKDTNNDPGLNYFAKLSVNRFSFHMTVMPRPMTIMTAAKR